MAFAMTMLILLGLMAATLIGITLVPGTSGGGAAATAGNSLQMTATRAQAATASELAASGVELTLQWLHAQAAPPSSAQAFAPALWGATLAGSPQRAVVSYPDAAHTFSIRIYPSGGNSGTDPKKYLIEATGTCGSSVQIVEAAVQQVSFAKYNYFSDQSAPDAYWISGVTSFDGPVHCNNSNPDGSAGGVVNNILWKTAAPQPIFSDGAADAVTMSGARINWFLGTPTIAAGPRTATDWSSLATGGAASVHCGTPVITFPADSTPQKLAALAGRSAPTTTGVTLPSSGGGGLVTALLNGVLTSGTNGGTTVGGVYVHGDVQEMTLAVGASNVQAITLQQQDGVGPFTTTILFNGLLNQTTVVVTRLLALPLVTFYAGIGNGVIYCDGNIGSQSAPKSGGLHGTILDNQILGALLPSNHLTIATDAGKNMNIDGSLQYSALLSLPLTQPLNTILTQQAGTLGLISNTIEVVDRDANNFPLTAVEVDAAILAFNTCDATDVTTRPLGTFKHIGSFLVRHGGGFGTVSAGGLLTSGLSTERHYDARLATNPPPVFPTTTTQYDILSWSCVKRTLE